MTKNLNSSVKFLELVANQNREPMLLLDSKGMIEEGNRAAHQTF